MIKRTRIKSPTTRQTIVVSTNSEDSTVQWHTINLLDIHGIVLARMFIDITEMEVDYVPRNDKVTTVKI